MVNDNSDAFRPLSRLPLSKQILSSVRILVQFGADGSSVRIAVQFSSDCNSVQFGLQFSSVRIAV